MDQQIQNQNAGVPCKLCEQIKDNGIRCGAPALRGERYCRFHVRMHDQSVEVEDPNYDLPVLETEQSVQIALQQMMRGLLSGKLSEKKGKLMLAGIKTAAVLIRQASGGKSKEELLNEIATDIRGRIATQADAASLPPKIEPQHDLAELNSNEAAEIAVS